MSQSNQPLDERVLESTVGALELFGVYLGNRLGLYEAIAGSGSVSESDLANSTGIAERYAREWLEQQAAAGYITVTQSSADPTGRRYGLSPEQHSVLVQADDPVHVSPIALAIVGVARTLPQVAHAYQSGGGVGFFDFGDDLRDGQGGINRPAFTHDLVDSWIPAATDVHERLSQERGSKIADLGCGQGWASIATARAYPNADVIGVDSDAASIEDARQNAASQGVNARFEHGDAAQLSELGPFDLVLILEVLHDLARPVEVLSAVRKALTPDGVILVADEQVADEFSAPAGLLERMMYGWSISHCLPSAMVEQPSEAIGTVIRPPKIKDLARRAGFEGFDVVDVDAGFFRLYRITTGV
jgi:2-polyprenyl-3-methyl-5-hydroxy-6-metoxy-1,4-benzoquinol methylase